MEDIFLQILQLNPDMEYMFLNLHHMTRQRVFNTFCIYGKLPIGKDFTWNELRNKLRIKSPLLTIRNLQASRLIMHRFGCYRTIEMHYEKVLENIINNA